MSYYAGIDVSLEASHVCVIDGSGKVLRERGLRASPRSWVGGVGVDADRTAAGAVIAMALCCDA
jgi:hypothetical protein